METKIPLAGKLAYEQQLIKHHRAEIKRFLMHELNYNGTDTATIMRYYDKMIKTDNIIRLHTHVPMDFLEALCTGNLESLYDNTSSKIMKHKEEEV